MALDAAVVHGLAFMFGILFLLVAGWAGYGVYALVQANRRSCRYLEQGRQEKPLQLDHLSGALHRLAQETRLLRISLESPLRDVSEFRRAEFAQSAALDVEALDATLLDVSRQLAEWVRTVESLPEADAASLADLGLGAAAVRHALAREGGAFERRNLHKSGEPPLDERLRSVIEELEKLEVGLQVAPQPYR